MADTPETGGPAFPPAGSLQVVMTLRDWFAGQALVGPSASKQASEAAVARDAYAIADAMLAERNSR